MVELYSSTTHSHSAYAGPTWHRRTRSLPFSHTANTNMPQPAKTTPDAPQQAPPGGDDMVVSPVSPTTLGTGVPDAHAPHADGDDAISMAISPWPWEYIGAQDVVVHPTGCTVCNLYTTHLALEEALGVRSLADARTSQARAVDTTVRAQIVERSAYARGRTDARREM